MRTLVAGLQGLRTMSERILLVRHGRSAHVQRGWLDGAGLRAWRTAYDAAGLAPGETPPATLRALASEAGIIVASDMPRAHASAALLARGAPIKTSSLLRESELVLPTLGPVRLPLAGRALATGLRLAVGAMRAERPPAVVLDRATEAAYWLAELAAQHGSVVAITHAAFRPRVVEALAVGGWQVPRRQSLRERFRHWSAWVLTRGSAGHAG